MRLKRLLAEENGFTLAELLATISVMSVLFAIGVPNYLALQPSMRLNGAARGVLGKFMWARSKAVEQNNQWVVTFPTNHTVQLLDDKNNNASADTGESTETFDIQADYSGVTVSSNVSSVVFSGRGTGSSATITVANAAGTKTVSVVASGNVKIN